MFEPVDTRQNFPKLEEEILRFWKENDIFAKSIDQRPEDKLYTFYEGPPTANARPGVHHVLSRAFKDLFPRYKTMRGYRVPRKAGWDTHGLPVELEVERELGLKSKKEIEEFGIEEFNRRCRDSVFRYVQEWEALTERIGYWLDLENAYITYDNEYIESVWWIIKQLWDNDLVYLDYRSAPHCPRCETSLSDAEVALGYEENTPDPSVYVKFRLTDESEAKLRSGPLSSAPEAPIHVLAWTTTPWTLPGNTALAVQAKADYVAAMVGGDLVILAEALAGEALQTEHEVVARLKGSDVVGLAYEPLYKPVDWGVQAMWFDPKQDQRLVTTDDIASVERAYTVLSGDFVSMDDGSGIVHVAPAFGGEDFQMGKKLGLLFLQPVDLRGEMPAGSPWPGQFVKDADEAIMEDLSSRGLLQRRDVIKHTYPFCWRCKTPLLYYAKPTWYVRTTSVKDSLIEGNSKINWYPSHIKDGRFGDWLQNNVDWALSRERYWGTPLPIWQCQSCNSHAAIGSRADLLERAVDRAEVEALEDLHRPYVDRIQLKCGDCDGTMVRRPEVIDAWFDSGGMPYAQWHYPLHNKDEFDRSFPADYICEAVDQTRGWFYTLHAEAVLLHSVGAIPENLSYRNVICLGHIQDEKGRKMSKSVGNVVEPMSVVDEYGADALRWYLYTATKPGDARRFSGKLVSESLRRFLLTLWNTYSFFVTYANLDEFDPMSSPDDTLLQAQSERNELDRWVLSELNSLVQRVTDRLEEYDPTTSGRAIQGFVDDLSNWYVRRSRRRFWKSGTDADKLAAYHTLYTCLVTVSKLMAPFTPFVSEAIYQGLVRAVDKEAPESVHLAEWPEADPALVDEKLMTETRLVMRVVSLGRAARSKAGLKVRQPLSRASVFVRSKAEAESLERLKEQIKDELNVREIVPLVLSELFTDTYERPADLLKQLSETSKLAEDHDTGYAVAVESDITPELADEGLARELVHRIQNMRKAAGFEIADHIITYHSGSDRVSEVLAEHGAYVRQETLSNEIVDGEPPSDAHGEEIEVNGETVRLAVKRVDS
ncbi:MAG: isoleucine--tRNA ligase [Chloroflexi bacterium]|nr:isoleucine--tRNA ligase [Chloroflexota bacterium]